jgi:hypothetical protein
MNIPDRQIEVYEQPLSGEGRYASKVVAHSPKSLRIALSLERHIEILVDDLLPTPG